MIYAVLLNVPYIYILKIEQFWKEKQYNRPANLATPKALRLGCLVGVAPIELLASHTHCRKIDDSE